MVIPNIIYMDRVMCRYQKSKNPGWKTSNYPLKENMTFMADTFFTTPDYGFRWKMVLSNQRWL